MSSEPHILHISTPATWRGGEQQLAYLYRELKHRGIEQTILCAAGSEMEKRCKEWGFNYHTQKKTSSISSSFARAVKRIGKQAGANLIHVHDSHAHTFAVMAAQLFGNKLPIVVSRRVDFPVKSSPLSKFKYNHSAVRRIVCVSNCIKEITAPAIKNKSVLTTVHSGIDINRFTGERTGKLRREYGIDNTELLIGNVAALAPHKDYFTFINTAHALKTSGVKARYIIIGEGNLRSEIEQAIATNNLQKDVIMAGFRNDVAEILPDLDIFLITSETEGLGTSILDAMACKVPVVATNAGGIPEVVIHEKTGLLGDVKDPNSLAKQVTTLANDANLRQQLIAGASQHLQQFTTVATAEKTLKIYQELLA